MNLWREISTSVVLHFISLVVQAQFTCSIPHAPIQRLDISLNNCEEEKLWREISTSVVLRFLSLVVQAQFTRSIPHAPISTVGHIFE